MDPHNHSARRFNMLAQALDARRYLEIGVFKGITFHSVAIEQRVALDVNLRFDPAPFEDQRTRFFHGSSDEFSPMRATHRSI